MGHNMYLVNGVFDTGESPMLILKDFLRLNGLDIYRYTTDQL